MRIAYVFKCQLFPNNRRQRKPINLIFCVKVDGPKARKCTVIDETELSKRAQSRRSAKEDGPLWLIETVHFGPHSRAPVMHCYV